MTVHHGRFDSCSGSHVRSRTDVRGVPGLATDSLHVGRTLRNRLQQSIRGPGCQGVEVVQVLSGPDFGVRSSLNHRICNKSTSPRLLIYLTKICCGLAASHHVSHVDSMFFPCSDICQPGAARTAEATTRRRYESLRRRMQANTLTGSGGARAKPGFECN